MKENPLVKWLYSLKDYLEESVQEEKLGTSIFLKDKPRSFRVRSHVDLHTSEESNDRYILSREHQELPLADQESDLDLSGPMVPSDPLDRIRDHFHWTQCDPKELHTLYQLERQAYRGPLLVLGHAREIEKELKHNLFLDAPPHLHVEVSQYFEQLDPHYFAFMLDALSGKSPATLGIIENWLKALGNMERDDAMTLHSKYLLIRNTSLQVLTRENSIEKMYRFRKLRNAATHGDIGEEQIGEFFEVTYCPPSFSKWVDDDFHIPEEGTPGFFSDYLAAGRSPYSGKL